MIRISVFGRTTNADLSRLTWVLLAGCFFILTMFAKSIMPDRFYYDVQTILDAMPSAQGFSVSDSFASTAYFYKLLGFHGTGATNILLSLLAFCLIFKFLWDCLQKANPRVISILDFFALAYFLFAQCAYLGVISKDLIVLILVYVFWRTLRFGVRGIIAWSLFAALYATYFRTQWFILLAVFWILFLLNLKKVRVFYSAIAILAFFLALAIVFQISMGVDLDHFRTAVNLVRLDSGTDDVRTMIVAYLPVSGFLSVANTSITFLFLMFPVPLLLLLSPYYFISFAAVSISFWSLIKALYVNSGKAIGLPETACFSLIMGSVAAQSLYEPDFGSYIRHIAPFLAPMFFLILEMKQKELSSTY